ncbi:MAG: PorT family protein [Bacteroidales bacterium]|nr:PorT family protein [Bacteroidales bacterium]
MKTKNLLVLILVLGLSFNAFSQEKITIKQVIKNKSTNASAYGDGIKIVQIWSSLPITIKSGKENAIYLTGDMKENEKEKLSSFCQLKNNIFSISSPYLFLDEEGKAKDLSDFTIILELADDVYSYFLKSSSNVTIKKDIITDESGTFNLWGSAQITLEGEVKFGVLNIFAQEGSKIRFNSINATAAILDMGKGSVIDFNGRVRDIEISNQGEGSKLIGDYKSNTLMTHHADIIDINDPTKVKRTKSIAYSIEDDVTNGEDNATTNIIKDTFKLSSLLEAFDNDYNDSIYNPSEDININDSNIVYLYRPTHRKNRNISIDKEGNIISSKGDKILLAPNSVEKKKEKWYYDEHITEDFGFQFGYGRLNWSNKVSNVDGLFASPQNQYSLRYGNSWTMGFRYGFKLGWNERWKISTGLGYESNIFRFDNNVKLREIGTEKRIGFETNPAIDAKSKLVARYVTLPLFVRFRAVKSLELHVGAIAGVNFKSSSTGFKRNYEELSGEVEERWGTKYDNVKPLKLDLQVGFGWDIMNFYVKYSLTPMFKDNKEIEVYPFSAGISLGL